MSVTATSNVNIIQVNLTNIPSIVVMDVTDNTLKSYNNNLKYYNTKVIKTIKL